MFWFKIFSEILNLIESFGICQAANLNNLYNTNMTKVYMKTLLEVKSKSYNYFSKLKLHFFTEHDINCQKRAAPVFQQPHRLYYNNLISVGKWFIPFYFKRQQYL